MKNSPDDIKKLNDTFLEKQCLYKEAGIIQKVFVKSIEVSDWGVKFQLHVSDVVILDNDWEYVEDTERFNKEFGFSAAWGIGSFRETNFHAAYINGTLNSNERSLKMFDQREENVYKMWNAS